MELCRFELHIEPAEIRNTTLLWRPSTSSFVRHNNDRQRRACACSAKLNGHAAWIINSSQAGVVLVTVLCKMLRQNTLVPWTVAY